MASVPPVPLPCHSRWTDTNHTTPPPLPTNILQQASTPSTLHAIGIVLTSKVNHSKVHSSTVKKTKQKKQILIPTLPSTPVILHPRSASGCLECSVLHLVVRTTLHVRVLKKAIPSGQILRQQNNPPSSAFCNISLSFSRLCSHHTFPHKTNVIAG